MFTLDGKCALVTGATGGIGAAIARALHGQGATLALSGTRETALGELVASIDGDNVHALACNLGDTGSVESLPARAEGLMGRVDILVNNAGITRDNLLMRMSDAEWAEVLDINLTALFRLCRASLRGMMKRRWGRIINIASVVGATGNAGQTNYAAAKAGMIGFGKSLAAEVASRGITVNSIAPGFIATAMTGRLTAAQKEAAMRAIPARRFGTPEDVAAGAVWLASEESAYVTGSTLHINGGMAML